MIEWTMDQQTWERLSTSRTPLRERVATYCLGVAVGFGLLAMLWMMRSQAARRGAGATPVPPAATGVAPGIPGSPTTPAPYGSAGR